MNKYKYPRTYHFSFSEGATSDDKILENDNMFEGKKIVITTKMDGENTTIYPDGTFHARSIDSKHREYHSSLLRKIPEFSYQIPEGYRICGEYLYAKHSIYYENLEDYFLVFSIWDENNNCLSWEDTKIITNELGLKTVPELVVGEFNIEVKEIAKKTIEDGQEGIVVRTFEGYSYEDFNKNIAKVVRKGHVQTDSHWTTQKIIPNKTKEI